MPLFGKKEKGPPKFLVREFQAHPETVKDCAVTPDEQLVLTASDDKTLKLWDLATGALRATLAGHQGLVEGCSISADGSVAASCGQDDTIRIWSLPDGALRREIPGQKALKCELSPDGSFVVAGGMDVLKVWDVATGQERATFGGHAPIQGVALGPDSSFAVAACFDLGGYRSGNDTSCVKVWDVASGWARQTIPFALAGRCAVTADGSHVVATSLIGFVGVWNAQTGEQVRLWKGGDGSDLLVSLALGPDPSIVVTGENPIKIWNVEAAPSLEVPGGSFPQLAQRASTAQPRAKLAGHSGGGKTGNSQSLAVGRSGRVLVSGGANGVVRIWDLAAALGANP